MNQRPLISHALTAVICLAAGFGFGGFMTHGPAVGVEKNQSLNIELAQIKRETKELRDELDSLRDSMESSSLFSQPAQSSRRTGRHSPPSPNPVTDPQDGADRNMTAGQYPGDRLRQSKERSGYRQYDDLFKKLGLTDEERSEFVRLYVEWQVQRSEVHLAILTRTGGISNKLSTEDAAVVKDKFQGIDKPYDESVRDLLGSQFEVYRDYQSTLRHRRELNRHMPEPIDAYVKDEIVQIFAEENRVADLPAIAAHMDRQARFPLYQQRLEKIRERDKKILERTSAYLTTEQQAKLEGSLLDAQAKQELQLEMNPISLD